MKINWVLMVLFSLAGPYSSFSQTPASGTQLEIGPTSSNQVTNGATIYSGALGEGNDVTATGSLAVGMNNDLFGTYSAVIGVENLLNNSTSVAVGSQNVVSSIDSVVVGSLNELKSLGAATSDQSFIVGAYNLGAGARYSLISGMNNYAYDSEASATLGYGLINCWSDCTVVGRYNAYDENASLLFVVGYGTDSLSDRKNALEVYSDGCVIMGRAQGDIQMGEFGN